MEVGKSLLSVSGSCVAFLGTECASLAVQLQPVRALSTEDKVQNDNILKAGTAGMSWDRD